VFIRQLSNSLSPIISIPAICPVQLAQHSPLMHIYATDLPSRLLSGHFLYSFIEFGAARGGGLERPLMSGIAENGRR